MKCLRPNCIRPEEPSRRGLCRPCYCNRIFRETYGRPKGTATRHADDGPTARMSDAELDAFVEANRLTMPTDAHQGPERSPRIGKAGMVKTIKRRTRR